MFWLSDDDIRFPSVALTNADGILAIGGDLSPQRLLLAYSKGIFPWYNEEYEPIVWWSPDPRFVLFPNELKVSKSMRPYFNQRKFEITFDQHFETVMRNCQVAYREGQGGGTWINEDMIAAYTKLNELGFAHSVEVWKDKELVGGLYGIALGKVFFGESMFAKVSNASKFGFISLVRKLKELNFEIIDCQQRTKHLGSLGGRSIKRADFLAILQKNESRDLFKGKWIDWKI
jgi:leucyl/phenylalanyl-tRNA--protein transferase